MRESRSNRTRTVLLLALLLCPTPAVATSLQDDAAGKPEPEVQDVYVVMRDMGLQYEDVSIRTIVPNEEGASALVGLQGGTLVDVVVTPTAIGWTLRDIYYVAGNAQEFQAWSGPWRTRVAEAERFIAAASGEGEEPQRRPEELAPLIWFEDLDESQRLWGLNPTTYRIMQTLRMVPALGGPMGGGGR